MRIKSFYVVLNDRLPIRFCIDLPGLKLVLALCSLVSKECSSNSTSIQISCETNDSNVLISPI